MPMSTKVIIVLWPLVFSLPGCLQINARPWQPGQYNLQQIERECANGTYRETFRYLSYEEKMNICVALFTQVHPPIIAIVDIFDGENHETANRVMDDLIQSANDNDEYMVWIRTLVWQSIVGGNKEEYREDCRKILGVLKRHEGGYWDSCVRVLERTSCKDCNIVK